MKWNIKEETMNNEYDVYKIKLTTMYYSNQFGH